MRESRHPSPLRGGVGGGGQRALNFAQNAFKIAKHVVIPETQHTITFSLDLSRSHFVSRSLHIVLATIKLDDEFRPAANEIDNERAD